MSQIKLIFLLVIGLTVLSGCTKTEVNYWDNGMKKSELTYRGDKLHGSSIWYHNNGNKQLECNYKNNLLQGKFTSWYFNGNIKEEKHYRIVANSELSD